MFYPTAVNITGASTFMSSVVSRGPIKQLPLRGYAHLLFGPRAWANLTPEDICLSSCLRSNGGSWVPSTRVVPRVWDAEYKSSHVPFLVVTAIALSSPFPGKPPLKVLGDEKHAFLYAVFGEYYALRALSETMYQYRGIPLPDSKASHAWASSLNTTMWR